MQSNLNREPTLPPEDRENEQLRRTRRAILVRSGERLRDAMSIEGKVMGVAVEQYVTTVSDEVPYNSARIRITPLQKIAEKHVPDISYKELYLYFPFDPDSDTALELDTTPSLMFAKEVHLDGTSTRYIFSHEKTSIFGQDEEVHVDVGHFPSESIEGIGLLPSTEVPLEDAGHFAALERILSIVYDTAKNRLAAQNE